MSEKIPCVKKRHRYGKDVDCFDIECDKYKPQKTYTEQQLRDCLRTLADIIPITQFNLTTIGKTKKEIIEMLIDHAIANPTPEDK